MLYCNIIPFFFSKFNRQLNIRHPRRFISKLNYSLAELTFGFHRTIPENNLGILLIQRHLDQNEIPKTRKKCSILENCTIKTNCWWLSSMIWSDHLAKEAFSLKFIFLFSSIIFYFPWYVLHKKCPYLELFWFFRIFPHSDWIRRDMILFSLTHNRTRSLSKYSNDRSTK